MLYCLYVCVSVCLTPTQVALYDLTDSRPHISVSKSFTDRWRDLGRFTEACNQATDWVPAAPQGTRFPRLEYSVHLNVFR